MACAERSDADRLRVHPCECGVSGDIHAGPGRAGAELVVLFVRGGVVDVLYDGQRGWETGPENWIVVAARGAI